MFTLGKRTLILEGGKIVKEARRIAAIFGKHKEELHLVLVSAVNHAVVHKDCTVLNQVDDAFDAVVNKANGIAIWLTRPIDEKGTTVTNLIRRKDKAGNFMWLAPKGEVPAANIPMLLATPFYDLVEVDKRNEAAPYSFDGSLAKLIERAESKKRFKTLSDYEKKEVRFIHNAYIDWKRDNPKDGKIISTMPPKEAVVKAKLIGPRAVKGRILKGEVKLTNVKADTLPVAANVNEIQTA